MFREPTTYAMMTNVVGLPARVAFNASGASPQTDAADIASHVEPGWDTLSSGVEA